MAFNQRYKVSKLIMCWRIIMNSKNESIKESSFFRGQIMNKSVKVWDRFAKNFDKHARHFNEAHDKILESTKKYLNEKDIVLDYGCATGAFTIEIAGNVKKIYGIDISPKMIDSAKRKKTEQKIENINFKQSIIFDESLKKETFDVVLAFNIFHLLDDVQKALYRINELLKPGGLLISAVPCMGDKRSFLNIMILILAKILGIQYMRFFKISNLKDMITNGNFKIVEAEKITPDSTEYFIVSNKK
jgi:2-polyprenyl-3-methyl-5-hydroxy-6-metoxy-1,4-benzoquinol methylase